MNRRQRWPVILTACLCAMGFTAGLTDLMVSTAGRNDAMAQYQQQEDNLVSQQPIPQYIPPARQNATCTQSGSTWTLLSSSSEWITGLTKKECRTALKDLNGG